MSRHEGWLDLVRTRLLPADSILRILRDRKRAAFDARKAAQVRKFRDTLESEGHVCCAHFSWRGLRRDGNGRWPMATVRGGTLPVGMNWLKSPPRTGVCLLDEQQPAGTVRPAGAHAALSLFST